MLPITCPYCGLRDERVHCGGEARRAPACREQPQDAARRLPVPRDNLKGLFLERWRHAAGCRRWFTLRDTVTHEIVEIYPMGNKPASKAAAAHADSWRRDSAAEARETGRQGGPVPERRRVMTLSGKTSLFARKATPQISRAATGGRVDRGTPVSFIFDGRTYQI